MQSNFTFNNSESSAFMLGRIYQNRIRGVLTRSIRNCEMRTSFCLLVVPQILEEKIHQIREDLLKISTISLLIIKDMEDMSLTNLNLKERKTIMRAIGTKTVIQSLRTRKGF